MQVLQISEEVPVDSESKKQKTGREDDDQWGKIDRGLTPKRKPKELTHTGKPERQKQQDIHGENGFKTRGNSDDEDEPSVRQ